MLEFVEGGKLEDRTCGYVLSVAKESEQMSVWCWGAMGRSKLVGGWVVPFSGWGWIFQQLQERHTRMCRIVCREVLGACIWRQNQLN